MDIRTLNDAMNRMPSWLMFLLILLISGASAGVGYVALSNYDITPDVQPIAMMQDRPRPAPSTRQTTIVVASSNLTDATRPANAGERAVLDVDSSAAATQVTPYPDQQPTTDMTPGVVTGKGADHDGFFEALNQRLNPEPQPDDKP